jgi:flagellar motility protein MotE (MotC chaperone)
MGRKKGRGTLHIIGGLLVASAALRLGSGGTEVIAESAIEEPSPRELLGFENEATDVDAILAAFRAREARIEERELQVTNRMEVLREIEAEVTSKLAAMTEAEEALRATLALAEVAAEADLTRLATVYENMKPKDTAALFTEMAPEFAAGFLGLMQPEAAAAVMTELESPVAYSISVMLAGRNASVPTE